MIARIAGFLVLLYALGFAVFAIALPRPLDDARRTDAIVVPTGGAGRIDRGIALLQEHSAKRMFVSGVAPSVNAADLARENNSSRRIFACCIDLGQEAVDTRSNASETAQWVRNHHYRSIRLVTSNWHVARARMELAAALGDGVTIVGDGVPDRPGLPTLVLEYNKLLLRRIALWFGYGG